MTTPTPATVTRPLADLALARPGDKGNDSDVTVFAPDAEVYELLLGQLTPERVKAHMGGMVAGEVTRFEVRNVLALKFVLRDALGGGGPASLRADNLGKALGGALLHLPVEVPAALDARLGPRPRPPEDPYAGADWRIMPG